MAVYNDSLFTVLQYKQQASQSLAQALKDKDAALAALAAQKEKDLQEVRE
jgi:hypothetical protein